MTAVATRPAGTAVPTQPRKRPGPGRIAAYALLVAVTVLWLFPTLWAILQSFRDYHTGAWTIANYTNGSIAAGGVVITPARTLTDTPREKDAKGVLAGPREQAGKLRQAEKEGKPFVQAAQ